MTRKETEQEEALDCLRQELTPGQTIYSVLRRVNRTGTVREFDFYAIKNNKPRWLTGQFALALGMKRTRYTSAIDIGMDSDFGLVYAVACKMYPNAFDCIGENCPSNDHSNGDRDFTPHKHTDGGYAFTVEAL